VLLAGCPGRHADPTHPPGPSAPVDAATAEVAGPSERECLDLLAHAISLGVEGARAASPDQLPTADEVTRLEADLRETYLPVCRAGTLEGHHCAMAATTLDELARCHATPSSSTSNSSVAPGGMTPAAPRSP